MIKDYLFAEISTVFSLQYIDVHEKTDEIITHTITMNQNSIPDYPT